MRFVIGILILIFLPVRVFAEAGPVGPGSSTSPSLQGDTEGKKINLPYQPAEEKKKKEAPGMKKTEEEIPKVAPTPPPPVVLPFILSKWPENVPLPDPEGF